MADPRKTPEQRVNELVTAQLGQMTLQILHMSAEIEMLRAQVDELSAKAPGGTKEK